MRQDLARWYAGFCGVFLLAQGISTLAARWIPAFDAAFPALLATTQMVAQHSLLHIGTALLGLAALYKGRRAPRVFAIGFGLFYLALGVAGMAGGSELCLGLKPFDHPFHILLGALGVLAFGFSRRADPPGAAHAIRARRR